MHNRNEHKSFDFVLVLFVLLGSEHKISVFVLGVGRKMVTRCKE